MKVRRYLKKDLDKKKDTLNEILKDQSKSALVQMDTKNKIDDKNNQVQKEKLYKHIFTSNLCFLYGKKI